MLLNTTHGKRLIPLLQANIFSGQNSRARITWTPSSGRAQLLPQRSVSTFSFFSPISLLIRPCLYSCSGQDLAGMLAKHCRGYMTWHSVSTEEASKQSRCSPCGVLYGPALAILTLNRSRINTRSTMYTGCPNTNITISKQECQTRIPFRKFCKTAGLKQ